MVTCIDFGLGRMETAGIGFRSADDWIFSNPRPAFGLVKLARTWPGLNDVAATRLARHAPQSSFRTLQQFEPFVARSEYWCAIVVNSMRFGPMIGRQRRITR
jgi:hypothetical protein